MTIKVGIGLTTYRDLSQLEVGEAVFQAHRTVSSKIVPNRVKVWSKRHTVETGPEFSALWATNYAWTLTEDRGRGEILDKSHSKIGAEWRRVNGIAGQGRVTYRSERDSNDTDGITIDHDYSEKVDWLLLFKELVKVTRPSYGMLHLFTEREQTGIRDLEHFERFNSSFAGEAHFVSWRSSLGVWRKPDPWQLEERRTYRFLPQLSWANVLGEEFNGQYDRDVVARIALPLEVDTGGMAFQITPSLSDVEKRPDEFAAARNVLRTAFKPDFFRNGVVASAV